MAAVHEVIARDGSCLYRGCDVELACEVYEAAPAGTRLHCRRDMSAATGDRQRSATDEPVPYVLTAAGYAAAATREVSSRASSDSSRLPMDEPVPYALTARADAVFVVDTANVAELRRRCPELFAPRPLGGAS